MSVSREDVAYIAALANVQLGEAELAAMEKDLGAIVDYVRQLGEVETGGVEPMARVAPSGHPAPDSHEALREDRARPGLAPEEALANAPAAMAGLFQVPKVITPK